MNGLKLKGPIYKNILIMTRYTSEMSIFLLRKMCEYIVPSESGFDDMFLTDVIHG